MQQPAMLSNREEEMRAKIATTKLLLQADRIRAASVLLALRYTLSRSVSSVSSVSSVEIK